MGNRWFGFAIVALSRRIWCSRRDFDRTDSIRRSRSVLLKQLDEDRSKLHGRLMAIKRETTVKRKGIRNDFSID